jgi:endoglucanase
MIDFDLLAEVCQAPGAPGYEHAIRKLVYNFVHNYCDECSVDRMGNVLAFKKGKSSQKLLIAAHMDEIGFVVSHIDKEGFVKFHPLGGFDPKTLTAQRVWIHGREDVLGVMGSKPIHIMSPEERKKPPQMDDFFIDTGLPYEELIDKISVGDSITRERNLVQMGKCINGKSLDNRISVYIALEALRRMKKVPSVDCYFAFTVQEEVGLRGAHTVANKIHPDFGIALDTTIAYDLPGSQDWEHVTDMGKGVAIKILDGHTISDPRMVQFLKGLAENHEIKWQKEVLPMGGTDTAALQRSGQGGSIAGALSIPTRHIHQVIEMCHTDDVEGAIILLGLAIDQMSQYDWKHKMEV